MVENVRFDPDKSYDTLEGIDTLRFQYDEKAKTLNVFQTQGSHWTGRGIALRSGQIADLGVVLGHALSAMVGPPKDQDGF